MVLKQLNGVVSRSGSIPEVMLGAAVRHCNRFIAEAALHYCVEGSVLRLRVKV